MIIGIGTDLVHVDRMAGILQKHGLRFSRRILTEFEREALARASRPEAYLAKRFAVKEAASKALGTGIGRISWQDFQISNNTAGMPELVFTGNAQRLFLQKGGRQILVSIADEQDIALAFVVLSR